MQTSNTKPRSQIRPPTAARFAALLLSLTCLTACPNKEPEPPAPPPSAPETQPAPAPEVVVPPVKPQEPLETRLAKSLIAAAPPSDLSSPAARDLAADALAFESDFVRESDANILWMPFEESLGATIDGYKPLKINPLVFARLYLSLFAFTGGFTVSEVEDGTLIELPVAFRAHLPESEYPHPLWFSQGEWDSYARTGSILILISDGMVTAIYRKKDDQIPAPTARKWDNRWRWQDKDGTEIPRVSTFEYVLSPGNPHLSELKEAFARLDVALHANKCTGCHTPENKRGAEVLNVFTYPPHLLSVRHAIPATVRGGHMPPANEEKGQPAGIPDKPAREAFALIADDFASAGDAALKFERARLERR